MRSSTGARSSVNTFGPGGTSRMSPFAIASSPIVTIGDYGRIERSTAIFFAKSASCEGFFVPITIVFVYPGVSMR